MAIVIIRKTKQFYLASSIVQSSNETIEYSTLQVMVLHPISQILIKLCFNVVGKGSYIPLVWKVAIQSATSSSQGTSVCASHWLPYCETTQTSCCQQPALAFLCSKQSDRVPILAISATLACSFSSMYMNL